jgi:hypothetical protein
MRLELTTGECRWLADLANKAKTEADLANKETPHPLLELRADNMAGLERKLNNVMQKQMQRRGRDAR